MEFFNSLTLDLKLIAIAMAVCVLLALFSGKRDAEKRYVVVLSLLAAVGVYRLVHLPSNEPAPTSAVAAGPVVTPTHTPIASTAAK